MGETHRAAGSDAGVGHVNGIGKPSHDWRGPKEREGRRARETGAKAEEEERSRERAASHEH